MIDDTIQYHTLIKVTPEAFHGVAPFGATDRDEDIVYGGVEYKTSLGYVPFAAEDDIELAPGNTEIEGFLCSIGISRAMIEKGVFDNAFIEWKLYDSSNDILVKTILSGYLGQCTLFKNRYVSEFRSIAKTLDNTASVVLSQTCRAELGDTKCQVNLATYTVAGTVEITDLSKLYFKDSTFTEEDDYYKYGYVTWLTGANAGSRADIVNFSNGEFKLFEPTPFTIAIGDTFEAVAGCDKRASTCQTKFSNMVNFRGEPYLPGQAYVYTSYAES